MTLLYIFKHYYIFERDHIRLRSASVSIFPMIKSVLLAGHKDYWVHKMRKITNVFME